MGGFRLFYDRKGRCTVGGCTNCICVKNNAHCSRDCSCGEACTNKRGKALPAGQMDIDALNVALVALAARFDAQQANQQQLGNVLQALAARVVPAAQNPQGAGIVVPPPGAQARGPVTLGAEVVYSGSPAESIVDWLQLVNRKATTENWGNDEKQRVATFHS